MAKRLKCFIYTRVSTEMQLDGYSLEAQKEVIEKEAAHRGMKIIGEYSDEGKSGKNIKGRPEFQKMLNDIARLKGDERPDYVIVFKLSRFGRNAADTLNSLQYMEDYGVHLLCVKDGIDSAGATGKLMISVLAAVAEIEKENIKEQTMAGREQKARDGKWNGGFAPYGYRLEHFGRNFKVLFLCPFLRRRKEKMAKQKSLEDLRKELSEKEAELEKAKQKLEQVEHKMNRLQNKIKTESKKQRDARTHALCFKAGHLEYIFPVIKDSGKTKFVQFIDGLAALPTVKEYASDFVYHPIEEVEG